MKMLLLFSLVALGGAIGSVARYGLTLLSQSIGIQFPLGTLTANLFGCFAIGVFAALAQQTTTISSEMRIFLTTGFCGGFTTFSSLNYEVLSFLKEDKILSAAVYVGVTGVGGFLAVYFGEKTILRLL
jgi:CrcB protein